MKKMVFYQLQHKFSQGLGKSPELSSRDLEGTDNNFLNLSRFALDTFLKEIKNSLWRAKAGKDLTSPSFTTRKEEKKQA